MGILWPRSGTVEFDNSGVRAPGAKATFYEGGTTTPLAVYQDAVESNPHTSPVEADANGRWPTTFIPYITSYDVLITTSAGTELAYPTQIPNLNPVEAAEDTADASELIQTGDIIFSPVTGTRDGFVRCNGRTMGSGASGATERANDDTADLYAFLWNNFANAILPVSGGRGGSAATDFAANKPIALLDGRSGTLRGVDDMGNSAASLLSLATFTTGDATTGGSVAGVNTHTLTTAQLAVTTPAGSISYTPAGTVSTPTGTVSQPSFTGSPVGYTPAGSVSRPTISVGGPASNVIRTGSTPLLGTGALQVDTITVSAALDSDPVFTGSGTSITATGTVSQPSFTGDASTFTGTPGTPTFTGSSFGSGSAHNNVSKSILGTFFMKL